jgi:hypothetical protein
MYAGSFDFERLKKTSITPTQMRSRRSTWRRDPLPGESDRRRTPASAGVQGIMPTRRTSVKYHNGPGRLCPGSA